MQWCANLNHTHCAWRSHVCAKIVTKHILSMVMIILQNTSTTRRHVVNRWFRHIGIQERNLRVFCYCSALAVVVRIAQVGNIFPHLHTQAVDIANWNIWLYVHIYIYNCLLVFCIILSFLFGKNVYVNIETDIGAKSGWAGIICGILFLDK